MRLIIDFWVETKEGDEQGYNPSKKFRNRIKELVSDALYESELVSAYLEESPGLKKGDIVDYQVTDPERFK